MGTSVSNEVIENPKTFISYSWSSPEHEAWVLKLATELEESGVRVILDKWDLREGADKYAFMEQAVTDATVRKVVVVCDRTYAEKADGRRGGVGTETQIISKELYEQVNPLDQKQKFVAVITEKDDEGKPYIPTFLTSRIYIDMSNSELHAENFDQLVRWIYDRPLYKRPDRGTAPTHILSDSQLALGTSSRFRLALDALTHGKTSATGAVVDYFETFARNLERFRIVPDGETPFDEQVMKSLEAFLPYRDEVIDLVIAIARSQPIPEMFDAMHSFFERLLAYRLASGGSREDRSADNFKFILNELFLYAIAALLKYQRFDGVNYLTSRGYYLPPGSPEGSDGGLIGYVRFRQYLESLNDRNSRLGGDQSHSLMAGLLRDRAKRSDLPLKELMQADFILFLRDELSGPAGLNRGMSWFPYTLTFGLHYHPPFELFTRSESTQFFDKFKLALGVKDKEQLASLLRAFESGQHELPRFGMYTVLRPAGFINLEQIGTRP